LGEFETDPAGTARPARHLARMPPAAATISVAAPQAPWFALD